MKQANTLVHYQAGWKGAGKLSVRAAIQEGRMQHTHASNVQSADFSPTIHMLLP